jgi:hypothetical protein
MDGTVAAFSFTESELGKVGTYTTMCTALHTNKLPFYHAFGLQSLYSKRESCTCTWLLQQMHVVQVHYCASAGCL